MDSHINQSLQMLAAAGYPASCNIHQPMIDGVARASTTTSTAMSVVLISTLCGREPRRSGDPFRDAATRTARDSAILLLGLDLSFFFLFLMHSLSLALIPYPACNDVCPTVRYRRLYRRTRGEPDNEDGWSL